MTFRPPAEAANSDFEGELLVGTGGSKKVLRLPLRGTTRLSQLEIRKPPPPGFALDFGSAAVEQTRTDQIEVFNRGTTPLNLTIGALTPPFDSRFSGRSVNLGGGKSGKIVVTFTPRTSDAPGVTLQQVVSISTNESTAPALQATLKGTPGEGRPGLPGTWTWYGIRFDITRVNNSQVKGVWDAGHVKMIFRGAFQNRVWSGTFRATTPPKSGTFRLVYSKDGTTETLKGTFSPAGGGQPVDMVVTR